MQRAAAEAFTTPIWSIQTEEHDLPNASRASYEGAILVL